MTDTAPRQPGSSPLAADPRDDGDSQRVAVWRLSTTRLAEAQLDALAAAPDATAQLNALGGRRVWIGERAMLGAGGGPRLEVLTPERVAELQRAMNDGAVAIPFDARPWLAPLLPGEVEVWLAVPPWRGDIHPESYPVGTVIALVVAVLLAIVGVYEVLFDR